MLKPNFLLALLAFAVVGFFSACCCCEDDEDNIDLCADLVVQDLNPELFSVSCPDGICTTTVIFTIENIGNLPSGSFNIRVVMDPSGSIIVNEFVPGGLDAGEDRTFTVVGPPGGNCFDPDCTIMVIADSNNDVDECIENNNTDSDTLPG